MASIGHEGLNNLLVAYEDKSAQAVATFGFSRGPGHEPILFQGRTDVRFMPPFDNLRRGTGFRCCLITDFGDRER